MGMYELLFAVVLIIFASLLWLAFGYNLKNMSDMVISIMPSDAFPTATQPISWVIHAFTIYLMFVSVLVVLWAMK